MPPHPLRFLHPILPPFPSPAGLLPFTAPPLSLCSLCLSPHFPLLLIQCPSASVWPPSFLSVSDLWSVSIHGVSPASLAASVCLPTPHMLPSAGPFIHRTLTSAQCWLCPGAPEPNRDGHECCSGPSPALFPWPHIALMSQSPAPPPHSPSSLPKSNQHSHRRENKNQQTKLRAIDPSFVLTIIILRNIRSLLQYL